MKKPSKEPVLISEESYLFDIGIRYTPEDLINMANKMKENNILNIEIDKYYDDIRIYEYRMETELEAEKRYNKEMKQYKKYQKTQKSNKESRKKKLIKEAKALGLELIEKNNSRQYLEQDATPIPPDLSTMGIQIINPVI